MKHVHWILDDHLCRGCGGRILRSVKNAGMTPGGNPIWRCADCDAKTTRSASDICWCGMHQRHQSFPAYQCLPYTILNTHPELLEAFRKCGCDPMKGGEVGILLKDDLRKYGKAMVGGEVK